MSYLSLYRKYRPNVFKEIIGQEEIVLTIQNSIINNKLGHAYLFCGPRGVGKTSLAKIFAKTINCLNLINKEACNECNICESFNRNNNLDLIDIDGASNNGVNEIRELKEKISLLPAMCKYKVYIIDEVHMLTISAFNALLKTLEEPPKHIIFIFATTEVHKIPLTIISRCQKFDFKRINKNKTINTLVSILEKEKKTYEIPALEQIALLSDGSLRDALSTLEQVIAYSKEEITLDCVIDLLKIPSKKEKIEYLLDIIKNNNLKVLTSNNSFFQNGIDLKNFTTDLINICKEIIIYKTTSNLKLLHILDVDDVMLFNFLTNEQVLKILDTFFNVLSNSNVKIGFEIASFKIMNFFKEVSSPAITIINDEQKNEMLLDHSKELLMNNNFLNKDNSEIKIFDHTDIISNEKNEIIKLENINNSIDIDNIEEKKSEFKNETIIISNNKEQKQDEILKSKTEKLKNDSIEIKNQIEEHQPFIWKKSDYFNLLHQADKYLRIDYTEKWKKINQYLSHSKFHKIAKMFLGTAIVAMMEKAIFLGCSSDKQSKLINTYSFTKNVQDFFEEIFEQQEIVIMAVSKKELPFISREYYQLKVANKLPLKTPINFKDYYQQEKDILDKEETLDSTTYQIVQELFDNVTLID